VSSPERAHWRRARRGREAPSGELVAFVCPLITVLAVACKEGDAIVTGASPPPSDAGVPERGVCGATGEACCAEPMIACRPPLACDRDSGHCAADPAQLAATRLCRLDGECEPLERCCTGGSTGTCRALELECPLPDLALLALADPQPTLIDRTYFTSYSCPPDPGCAAELTSGYDIDFPVAIANLGSTDFIIGSPAVGVGFRISSCDSNAYVNDFLRYELLSKEGSIVKTSTAVPPCATGTSPFDCDFQGIVAGSIVRHVDTNCTGVDIDDVPPGDYVLRITVNPARIWTESDYSNNTLELAIALPSLDPLVACSDPPNPLLRFDRSLDCGWTPVTADGSGACSPGEAVIVECSACNGSGLIGLRVCEGTEACSYFRSEAESSQFIAGSIADESSCISVIFTCPSSGRYGLYVQHLAGVDCRPISASSESP
jgi:hypothetical protein